ncbi:T9SS type A sorting domain-containing protein [Pontibacter beigongshangensis]|uniref:T9SS type A sorting domain-containing protein n=1 Tax=Pontibacter beigongshangensis TaxID=2574733 RepID=UPI001650C301|nr:T9SS type A sorting domain-containing protein [Pontibacter beigongshangensis]
MKRNLHPESYKRLYGYLKACLLAGLFSVCWLSAAAQQQEPVIKVDLNIAGRPQAEVNEPGYIPWVISEKMADSLEINGVKIKFTGGFSSDWYKAGVQAPHYARLANDGLVAGGPLEMRFSGLPEGTHTLLTFHNTFANPLNNTFSPVDIFVDGTQVVDNLVASNRTSANHQAESAYLTLNARAGEDVVVRFEVASESAATLKQLAICGFELNTANQKQQARLPQPADGDEHVMTEGNSLTLIWEPAAGAVSHDVYYGTSAAAVASADQTSGLFVGNQTKTEHPVSGLYSMQHYYWRVDEVDAAGNRTRGNVWSFKPAQLAFPGAEGYGRFAIGGRGGKVVEVTNLNDSGPGSLREAVTNDIGPRTIIFAVSGIIELESRLVMSQPYVTIAGQTAPGKGITIRKSPFGVTGNDVILRHLRVRLGAGPTADGMGLTGADHSIIDHSSISWTIDEAFSSRGGKNITLQRTLISEALNVAGHKNYPAGTAHGYAATIGGDIGSFHHNLLAHNAGRNWSLGGGLDGNGVYAGRVDIRNNVVYNWDNRTTDGGAHEVNFVNNYYKPGAATRYFYALNAQHEKVGTGTQRYYFSGNVMPGRFDESNQQAGRRISGSVPYETFVDEPFFPSYVTTHSAGDAFKHVLSDVGNTQPVFDDHDIRVVNETLNGTFTYRGSRSNKPGLPDSHLDVGGYEEYPVVHRAADWDSDHDGLPDWWETTHNLNLNSGEGDFSDANADPDRDGFTNLEDYLEWMANPHYFMATGQQLEIDLAQYARGFTDNPVFAVADAENGEVVMQPNSSTASFTPDENGLAAFKFTVTDAAGSSMTRTIGIYVGSGTLGLEEPEEKKFDILCYPNPAKDVMAVSVFMERAAAATVTVSNILGSKISDNQYQLAAGENKVDLKVSSLASGIYIITVATPERQKAAKFVIK